MRKCVDQGERTDNVRTYCQPWTTRTAQGRKQDEQSERGIRMMARCTQRSIAIYSVRPCGGAGAPRTDVVGEPPSSPTGIRAALRTLQALDGGTQSGQLVP